MADKRGNFAELTFHRYIISYIYGNKSKAAYMQKILISVPDDLACRLRIVIPLRQRSKIISRLIAQEVEQREKNLYNCALSLEQDELLNEEMKDWDVAINDGLKEL